LQTGFYARANHPKVVGIKDLLNVHGSPNSSSESDASYDQGLNLLFATKRSVTQAEILASIPPRDIVDRLISRYFSVMDMALGSLTKPIHSEHFQGANFMSL
jgi:hypothetical protein